jgi:peptidyl-prolyl cis-trans isomerase D
VGGHFDRNAYVETLRRNNLKPIDFEDAQREELLITKLQDLIRSGVHVTDEELREQYRHENEKVNLRYVTLTVAKYFPDIKVTDDEGKAYLAEHQETFREPERSAIRYLLFTPEQFASQIEPSEDDLKAYFEAHQSDYQTQEQVRARHILFKIAPGATDDERKAVRAKAEAVLAEAKGGGDFAELAKKNSEDSSASAGGDLGLFSRGQMVPTFEKAAFALEPGGVSDLVESPFGLHIIKVDEKHPAHSDTFEEARARVLAEVQKQRGREAALAKAEDAHEKILNGEDLAAVATALGVKVDEPPPFALTETLPAIGMNKQFYQDVFNTGEKEIGEIATLEQGYLVYQVVSRIPTHVPQFDEIKVKVLDTVTKERASAQAKAAAEKVLERLKNKEAIDAVAAAEGLTVKETGPVGRVGGYVTGLGNLPDLKEAAFQLTPEQPLAPRTYDVNGDAVVAVLGSRIAADNSGFDKQKDALRDRIRRRLEAAAVEVFVAQLKGKAQIEIGQAYAAQSS